MGCSYVFRLPDYLEGHAGEHVLKTVLEKGDAQVSNVYPYPAPFQFLSRCDGGTAAAEGIEYDVTWVCAGVDYALEQSQGFLCWVAKAFRVLS